MVCPQVESWRLAGQYCLPCPRTSLIFKDLSDMNTTYHPTNTPPVSQYTPGDTGKAPSEPRLFDQMRAQIRLCHYSLRTGAQ